MGRLSAAYYVWVACGLCAAFLLLLVLTTPTPRHVAVAAPSSSVPLLRVCGFVTFRVCTLDHVQTKLMAVVIRPSEISRITNPTDSPKGCVRIQSMSGQGLYVYGSEQDVADATNRAYREVASMGAGACVLAQ